MQRSADLALGLYRTDIRNRGGYIQFDEHSKKVELHIDKTNPHFPDTANNSWAIACWKKTFTEVMHKFLGEQGTTIINGKQRMGEEPELLFGDVIEAALNTPGLTVIADFVDQKRGFYWDITNPEKYFDLLKYRSPIKLRSAEKGVDELDEMLPLYRRKCFDRDLQEFVDESSKNNQTLGLLMVDPDKFKSINDQHGHQIGDETLRDCATIALRRIQGKGRAYRFGGDEMAMLLPNFSIMESVGVAETLRQSI